MSPQKIICEEKIRLQTTLRWIFKMVVMKDNNGTSSEQSSIIGTDVSGFEHSRSTTGYGSNNDSTVLDDHISNIRF
jgi:hypothetical protein